ncbi:MAG: hypothetical protein U1E76_15465 [Planctomycetota bacterium]
MVPGTFWSAFRSTTTSSRVAGARSGKAYHSSVPTGALLKEIEDGGCGDHFGAAVASLPDTTGDGVPEFAIAQPNLAITAELRRIWLRGRLLGFVAPGAFPALRPPYGRPGKTANSALHDREHRRSWAAC